MHRLFLDANILFSAAYRRDSGLVQFWKLNDTTLCSSRYALEEARINLAELDHLRAIFGIFSIMFVAMSCVSIAEL